LKRSILLVHAISPFVYGYNDRDMLPAGATSIIPGAVADVAVSGNAFQATLPAYSVTTYAFVP
jgi:hypothetical protein